MTLLLSCSNADQLCQQLPGVDVDRFPALPTDLTVPGSTAETRARIYLAEGSGSYWAAIRRRCHLAAVCKPQMVFSAGAYGHRAYTGLHKQTLTNPAVCCLINCFLQKLEPQLYWTTFAVLCNCQTDMHIDNQTSNVESIVLGLSHFEGGQLWLQRRLWKSLRRDSRPIAAGRIHEISCRCYAIH